VQRGAQRHNISIVQIDIEDEKKLRIFYEKRMAQEVSADALGDEFKGYIFKITGGNDKQGFPMMQGVLVQGRVRLLLREGHSGFRPRRDGERKRKSVRGCIVGPDIAALDLVVIKKGDAELPGITDKYVPRRLGPKRASKIRKLFNLSKEDDVRKYALTYSRPRPQRTTKDGKGTLKRYKMPYIQRLVTPRRITRKSRELRLRLAKRKLNQEDAAAYAKLIKQRSNESRDRASSRRQRSSLRESRRSSQKEEKTAEKAEKPVAKGVAKEAPKGKVAAKGKEEEKPAKPAAKGAKAPAKAGAKSAGKKAPAKPEAKGAKKSEPAKPEGKGAKSEASPKPAKAESKASPKPESPAGGKKAAAKPAAEAKAAGKPAAKKQKQ